MTAACPTCGKLVEHRCEAMLDGDPYYQFFCCTSFFKPKEDNDATTVGH